MRDNLRRYAIWQLKDFARERGIALILIGIGLGFTMIVPFKAMRVDFTELMTRRILILALPQVTFISAFVALNGLVSNDRKAGYYRFLFSKPVNISAFYAQLFAIYFVGFVIVFSLLLGVFAAFVAPISPLGPLAYAALVFLSLGGIAFFISSIFRFDWPVLAAVFLGSSVLHTVWQTKEGWRRLVVSVLPPLHKLTPILTDVVNRGTADANSVLSLLGYSAIFFVAGLYVLRRRRFA